MRQSIPVTLVTGFLGAGKTTLLQHLLQQGEGRKFAVIENEFGDTGVDGLLVDTPNVRLYELNDGCICCTVRDGLLDTFERILREGEPVDHVIIESTGLAEPAPVMRLFDKSVIRDAFTFNGVITVVDAAFLEQSLAEVAACKEQIVFADLLVLNKVDRSSSHALDGIEVRLRQMNPLATIIRAQRAQVDINTVFDLQRPKAERSISCNQIHREEFHEHDEEIGAVAVEMNGEVDLETLDLWLGDLSRSSEQMLLRMKGILAISGYRHRFVFQGVRSTVDARPDSLWGEDRRFCRIVFIGKGLDHVSLTEGLRSCLTS